MPSPMVNERELTPDLIARVKKLSITAREELMDILIDCAEPLPAEAEQFQKAWVEQLTKSSAEHDTTVMEPITVKKGKKQKE